ncbi:asialoglycoprotein receptor 2-like [Lithobates pipiens]
MQKEILQMKNEPLSSDIQSIWEAVRKLEDQTASISTLYNLTDEVMDSELTCNLTDEVMASSFSDIQWIMELLGKVAEEVQKMKRSSNPLCSEGWRRYGLSCYYLSSDSKTWNDAKKACEDKKAHLIVINSVEEMKYLCRIKKDKPLWIGLTDQDGTWRWVDGTPYDTTPKFWGFGQPDDRKSQSPSGREDCAVLRSSNDWNDSSCSRKIQYICEKKIIF